MPGTRSRQDEDVISRLADAGEDALRRLVDLPRRTFAGAVDEVEERLNDLATRLRALDPLALRVAALEKRLDSLEKPKKTPARRASTRSKPSATRRATTAATLSEPEQAEHDLGPATPLKQKDEPE